MNAAFHAGYGEAREAAQHTDPVLVVLGDDLFLLWRGKTTTQTFTPPAFHCIKAAAHAPLALYATRCGAKALPPGFAAKLEAARDAAAALTDEGARADALEVLTRSIAVAKGNGDGADPGGGARLDAFARSLGPLLLRLTDHATRLQLAALHAATEAILEPLGAEERRRVHVVVAGAHQARARSLPMQYFRVRCGEAPGQEDRVTYAEAVDSPDDALALIGTQRVDRAIAEAFFGDPKRLQQDVLGEAAEARLGEAPPPPL